MGPRSGQHRGALQMKKRDVTSGGERRVHTSRVKHQPQVKKKDDPPPVEESDHNAGAQAAMRALGMTGEKKKTKANKGAQQATFGAQLMESVGSLKRKAVMALALGIALLGITTTASADVIHIGKGAPTEQAAQKIAQQANEPFVQVDLDKAALDTLFKRAEAGEVKLTHLIISYDDKKFL